MEMLLYVPVSHACMISRFPSFNASLIVLVLVPVQIFSPSHALSMTVYRCGT